MAIRTVFMGSPEFAVPSLRALAETTELMAVVCQPDKPAGRGLELHSPAVKTTAQRMGIPVLQPISLRPNKSNFLEEMRNLRPDLVVVVAYGKILPPDLLAVPRWGCWNVHGSILPKYRGAAPIQWALIQGEKETGVTLMHMDAGMDTGPMLLTRAVMIQPDDTTASLQRVLADQGAALLREGLYQLMQNTLPSLQPQDSSQATIAPLLTKEHGRIDFTRPAPLVSGHIRGVDPWPGAFTYSSAHPEETIKLFQPVCGDRKGKPGEILNISSRGLLVGCGEGAVEIAELQAAGRKRLKAQDFVAGFPLPIGTILGGGLANPLLSPI